MATKSQAAQAFLFMRRCRHNHLPSTILTITRSSSSTPATSRFDPSNFDKPLTPPTSKPSVYTPFHPAIDARSIWDRPVRAPWHYRPAKSVPIPPPSRARKTFAARLRSLFGLKPHIPEFVPAPFQIHNNPYRARKTWPPDLRKLHPKQQLNYEKRFRRRAKLKWARPTWTRWTKLIQNTLLIATTLYFVLILEPSDGQGTPFDGFRVWFFGKLKRLTGLSEASVEEVEALEREARETRKNRKTFFDWWREGKDGESLWEWAKKRFPG